MKKKLTYVCVDLEFATEFVFKIIQSGLCREVQVKCLDGNPEKTQDDKGKNIDEILVVFWSENVDLFCNADLIYQQMAETRFSISQGE